MDRIWLSRSEKRLLRALSEGGEAPRGRAYALYPLARKGLAEARYEEGGGVADGRITGKGREYLAANPSLRNPIPWPALGFLASLLVTALCAALCAAILFQAF